MSPLNIKSESDLRDLFSCIFSIKNILFSQENGFLGNVLILLNKSGCLSTQKQKLFTENYNGQRLTIVDNDYIITNTTNSLKYKTIQFFNIIEDGDNYKISSNNMINTNNYQILIFVSNNLKKIISVENRNIVYHDMKYIIPKENLIEEYVNNSWVSENNCY